MTAYKFQLNYLPQLMFNIYTCLYLTINLLKFVKKLTNQVKGIKIDQCKVYKNFTKQMITNVLMLFNNNYLN